MIPAVPFGKEAIEAILPHRDPFLLLDEVIELIPGKKVVATRLVRADDAAEVPEHAVAVCLEENE